MNAPLFSQSTIVRTTDRPEFKQALEAAKAIGANPTRRKVAIWAELMKRALNGGDRQ